MIFRTTCIYSAVLAAFAATAPSSFAASAAITAIKPTPEIAQDMGLAPVSEVKSLTLALKLQNRSNLEAFIASSVDPASPGFRHFLTPQQFKAAYGQSDATIERIRSYLAARGIAVTKVYANNLFISIKATNAQIANVFGSQIHAFKLKDSSFQQPEGLTAIPAEIGDVVGAVAGLSTRAAVQPARASITTTGALAAEAAALPKIPPTPQAAATNTPGAYTVADVANQYNINPLYARGLTGKGVTVGIVAFSGFTKSDAFTYWSRVGLKVDPNRITEVPIDGGSQTDGTTDGPFDTTIAVEQAGGLAPGAALRIYEGPTTDVGAIDTFTAAVNDNIVDTLSTNWGLTEITQDQSGLPAYDAIFMQAAAQGIPISAGSGNHGAYDVNAIGEGYTYPTCTPTLTVQFPASSPYVLAVGGTTLPVQVNFSRGSVTVDAERPWARDVFKDYFVSYYGQRVYYTIEFPYGSGGGVSLYYDVPSYQAGLPGVKLSQKNQTLYCGYNNTTSAPPTSYISLPGNFAGRNVPDVSLNADPYTGFQSYIFGAPGVGGGGTLFPVGQVNGILGLLTEQYGRRVGFANPQFYSAFKTYGYSASSPFRALTTGDNLYYKASAAYNPASGLGTLDVDKLSDALAGKSGK